MDIIIKYGTKEIEERAFECCDKFTNIEIPDSVERIREEAFYYCSNLKNITIPNSVWLIEGDAFYGCKKLRSIIIPDSVEEIGYGAFNKCNNLVVHTNNEYAIEYCKKNNIKFKRMEETKNEKNDL